MRCAWFRDCFRQVHMDFHMPEFPPEAIRNFDAKTFVDHLERGRVNMVALFAKCHFGNSFYNTSAGHKHSGLPQDFLMEAATECRQRGIRTLAYYSLCCDGHAWNENPAWRFRDVDGNDYGGDAPWGVVCMNTPYKDELVMPQLTEIAAYPVDGYFLDIPIGWRRDCLCYCDSCRRKAREESGIELSPDLPLATRLKLVMRTVVRYHQELRQIIATHNPDLVICTNAAGTPHMSKPVKELVEIGVWESQPHAGDYLGHSFAARTVRNDIVDGQVMTVRFYQGWGDLSLKPTPQLTTECAAMIANGAVVNCGDQVGVDGTLQPPVYDTLAESFGFIQQREAVLRDAHSVRHAVVLLPVPDPELPFDYAVGHIDPVGGWICDPTAWRGAHKMLVESHIQTDLVYSVLADDLSAYPLIVLPEPAQYSPDVYQRLRQYVDGGGTLVAVGRSCLHDGQFELADVFGIDYVEPLSFSLVHFVPSPAVRGATADIPLQVRGQAFKVRLNGADEVAAMVYPAAEYQPPVKAFRSQWSPPAAQRSPFPFATVHPYGRGRAVYIAASIFDIYWKTNHHWLRQFVEALVRHVDPTVPYHVEASGRIEANLMRTGSDLLLNLVHYAFGHQGGPNAISAVERVDPVCDIACSVRCPKTDRVVLEPEGESIPFTHDDGQCRFTVPRIEYLAMVRLVGAG